MTHQSAQVVNLLHAVYDLDRKVTSYMQNELENNAGDPAWQEMYAVNQALGSAITQLQMIQKRNSQTTPDSVCVNGTTYAKVQS